MKTFQEIINNMSPVTTYTIVVIFDKLEGHNEDKFIVSSPLDQDEFFSFARKRFLRGTFRWDVVICEQISKEKKDSEYQDLDIYGLDSFAKILNHFKSKDCVERHNAEMLLNYKCINCPHNK